MVKVLHVVGDSKFGGGSRIILRLAQMAREQGWEANVLTTDPMFQQALRDSGIGVVDLDVIWRDVRLAHDLRGLLTLYQFLSNGDYTVVHTHTSKAGLVGRLAARLAGVPVILHTVHGFAFHEASRRVQRAMYSTIERVAAHLCDHIVCVSEFHCRWAQQLGIAGADKITAIPNGVTAECARVTMTRQQIRRMVGVDGEEFVILSVGRLVPQKGFEYLLEATAKLVHHMQRPFRVVIAGDGWLRNQLEERARNLLIGRHVIFLGFRDDIANLLSAADLVVLPSLWEGLSIALLEAMVAARPIVTTMIGSNLEVAGESSEAALLVPPADADALADAILRCSEDKSLRDRLARNAQAVVQQRYTDDVMLSKYRELYVRLLQAKRVLGSTASVAVAAN